MDIRKVVDGHDGNEHDWEFDQTTFFTFLFRKLGFSCAKITHAMRDLLDPFAGSDRQVAHLNTAVPLSIFLCPPVVHRSRDAGSGPYQDQGGLCEHWSAVQAEKKQQTTGQYSDWGLLLRNLR